ncbi:unnamed protein product [Darwinula stevensoni]|uniref:Uncharacterized protein n=1 Tax=Darwinula stevensoni TaxID=69355 RepID=A0A7R9FSU6_9CRUS|nr:unnamed protein product [Darwinula stevensoni]CAG0903876.1 unnamed protein product [Darwinula stevensoni]
MGTYGLTGSQGEYTFSACATPQDESDNVDLKTDKLSVGVMMLKVGVDFTNMLGDATFDNMIPKYLVNFTTPYCLQSINIAMLFYDEKKKQYDDVGIQLTSVDSRAMSADVTHLTTFGGGFFVMPNAVDFTYVFSHAGFDDNITIYMLLIVTGVIYLTLLIWARWQDGLDVALVKELEGHLPNAVDFTYVFSHAGFDDNITIYMLLIVTGVIYLTLLIWARWQDGLDVALVVSGRAGGYVEV